MSPVVASRRRKSPAEKRGRRGDSVNYSGSARWPSEKKTRRNGDAALCGSGHVRKELRPLFLFAPISPISHQFLTLIFTFAALAACVGGHDVRPHFQFLCRGLGVDI